MAVATGKIKSQVTVYLLYNHTYSSARLDHRFLLEVKDVQPIYLIGLSECLKCPIYSMYRCIHDKYVSPTQAPYSAFSVQTFKAAQGDCRQDEMVQAH